MRTDPPTLLPFTRSYWASPARLLGGFYPGDRDPAVTEAKLTGLLDCGVSHIINLMEAEEGDHAGRAFISYKESFLRLASQRGRRVIWMRHPLRDLGVPTPAQMTGHWMRSTKPSPWVDASTFTAGAAADALARSSGAGWPVTVRPMRSASSAISPPTSAGGFQRSRKPPRNKPLSVNGGPVDEGHLV